MSRLELWAGAECTVNRVGEQVNDELKLTGVDARLEDLDRLASLGITRMRFPLVWERTEFERGRMRWAWADARLARLHDLNVKPIAGLVHHGSGPAWTHLLDPAFPALLAEYAGIVARRYPDIDAWTPVNEPLTTARFSALYGVWYPHARDDRSFARALLNEVRATVLAMRAIREVNPQAMLVQTDDLGFVSSTPALAYQARFENERRWLGFDLLIGRVDRHHPMWDFLVYCGIAEDELQALVDAPCPPDIIGINHYITSERHLDERIDMYPPHVVGGNGRHTYADVETVRVGGPIPGGFDARLREACERYGLPVAVTETHLGSSREEQLRWLHQTWQTVQGLREEGCDIRAVTCWAAFGTYDWDSLVTRIDGHYEPGLWDVRCTPPRPTALSTLARQLAQGRTPTHPVLEGPGWWQRADRIMFDPGAHTEALPVRGRPVLICGARGTLGQAFARLCGLRGLPYRLLSRTEMDIANADSVEAALQKWKPWAVINAAGYVRVDDAEDDERCWRENAEGAAVLAACCARHRVRLVGFSSDLVFDGSKEEPYVESDATQPLNAYGRSKAGAEEHILDAMPDALVVRTAAFFGPWDAHNFVTLGLQALRRGEPWLAADDQWVSPTYVPDLVHTTLDLLIDGERGIWHLANHGAVTWHTFARMAAEVFGLEGEVVAAAGASLGWRAARPQFSVLGSERGQVMPSLEDALLRYKSACEEAEMLARQKLAEEVLA